MNKHTMYLQEELSERTRNIQILSSNFHHYKHNPPCAELL